MIYSLSSPVYSNYLKNSLFSIKYSKNKTSMQYEPTVHF